MKYVTMPYFGNIQIDPIINQALIDYPKDRITEKYQSVFKKENPLVSVITTTYNKCNSLTNYSLKSILEQTYTNLEIIICGDVCTDDTTKVMKEIEDPRVIFIDLLGHPPYPTEKRARWQVAGVYPRNLAESRATGDFITYLDDDDTYVSDRIEKLIKFAQINKCDAIHHPFLTEGDAEPNPSNIWMHGGITTSAIFTHGWFSRIFSDYNCWKINEPGDWNRCKKLKDLGANIKRYPEVLTIKKISTTF